VILYWDFTVLQKDPGALSKDPKIILKDPGILEESPGALQKDPGNLSKNREVPIKAPRVFDQPCRVEKRELIRASMHGEEKTKTGG